MSLPIESITVQILRSDILHNNLIFIRFPTLQIFFLYVRVINIKDVCFTTLCKSPSLNTKTNSPKLQSLKDSLQSSIVQLLRICGLHSIR